MSKPVTKKNSQKRIGWRRQRGHRQIGLGLFVLSCLVFLILWGKSLNFIKDLGKPHAPDSYSFAQSVSRWDGTRTINLVIKSKGVSVLSYNPATSSVTILDVPDETYLNLPFNFGRWPTRSVYDLGQVEKPPIGAKLLEETIASVFGISIDGYLIFSGKSAEVPASELIEGIRHNPFSGIGLLTGSKTDLDTMELTRLWWGLKGIRSDKVKTIDLEQSPITESALLGDGSRALGIDQLKLDQIIQDRFTDTKLRDEGSTIGIFNATDYPGLAEKAARIVTNMGGRVIFTSNNRVPFQKTVILGKPSYTTFRLGEIFGTNCSTGSGLAKILSPVGLADKEEICTQYQPERDFSRADVTVILGADYFLRYSDLHRSQ